LSTASSLVGLGKSLLAATGDGSARARRFIAVDLPGHGKSAPPVGALFGELGLQDYVAAVLGVLDRLAGRGIRVTTLVGHSMGGITVLLVQKSLVQRGKSLREAYGVEHVLLLAPGAWPEGIPCAVAQNPQMGAALGQFQVVDPTLGPVVVFPAAVYQQFTWSRADGAPTAGAPTPAEIEALEWVTPESLSALAGVMGAPPVPRATFDRGIFGPRLGTKLDIVSFQHDTIVLPEENKALYPYATGESPEHGWTTVTGANALHGMPISHPAELLAAVAGRVKLS
jgi:pimeloyl-ACP methyl ester carboxylesterase